MAGVRKSGHMRKRQVYYAILAGIFAGIVLGFFLKIFQFYFGVKVYVLLLNIDYILVLKTMDFPEWVEFSFQLLISVAISLLLQLIVQWYRWKPREIFFYSVLASIFIAILIYPTTLLSPRTPSITSVSAILLWLIGHSIYGMTLSVFFVWCKEKY